MRCIAQLRPGSSFLRSAPRFPDRKALLVFPTLATLGLHVVMRPYRDAEEKIAETEAALQPADEVLLLKNRPSVKPRSIWSYLDGQGFLIGFMFGNGLTLFISKMAFYLFGDIFGGSMCKFAAVDKSSEDSLNIFLSLLALVTVGPLIYIKRLAARKNAAMCNLKFWVAYFAHAFTFLIIVVIMIVSIAEFSYEDNPERCENRNEGDDSCTQEQQQQEDAEQTASGAVLSAKATALMPVKNVC